MKSLRLGGFWRNKILVFYIFLFLLLIPSLWLCLMLRYIGIVFRFFIGVCNVGNFVKSSLIFVNASLHLSFQLIFPSFFFNNIFPQNTI